MRKDFLKKIKKNISLRDYTTFKIGGEAKFFLKTKNKEELKKAIEWAKEKGLPFFILGGGSNLLVSDKGFKGLVIKIELRNLKNRSQEIFAEAGVKLETLVKVAEKRGLTGLEWAAGIPGTLGGAIRGNAAAFNCSISEIIKEIEVLNTDNLKWQIFKPKDLKFGYRDSFLKKRKNLIISSARLKLKKGDKKKIKEKIENNLRYRKENHPLEFPSVGSIFKNLKFQPSQFFLKYLKKFPELEKFKQKGEIPAAYLIEQCGLKGFQIGKVGISNKHSNFIINLSGISIYNKNWSSQKKYLTKENKNQEKAKAKDVLKLIKLIKRRVKNKFDIELEEEIEYLK